MKKLAKKVDRSKKLVAFYALNESNCNAIAYCANNSGNCVSKCS